MKINDLNFEIIYERTMDTLAADFQDARHELNVDLSKRITLKDIQQFVRKWKFFTTKFDISKKRITEIEQKGKALLKYLRARVKKLENVKTVSMDEITPMKDYLDNFAMEIDMHIEIQKAKYSQAQGTD